MGTRRVRWAGMVLVSAAPLLLLVSGCGGNNGADSGSPPAAPIVVDGSSTVYRISKAAQIAYAAEKGDEVTVLVGNHGTGGGFGRYLNGEVDIVDASRAAKPEEESQASEKGYDWTRFVVGYDGITLVVNAQNDFVKELSVEQLKALFEPDSKVTTWKDLDPSWPDRRIVVYSPDNDSGTYEFFVEAIMGNKDAGQRKDVQASADDNTLVTGVAGDADGLGYFGYAYYAANKERLKAVAVRASADQEAVTPSHETILDQSYEPLSRPLYIYVKNSAAKRPEVVDFLSFYLEKIDTLSEQGGYVPPTAQDKADNQASLDTLKEWAGETGGEPAAEAQPVEAGSAEAQGS